MRTSFLQIHSQDIRSVLSNLHVLSIMITHSTCIHVHVHGIQLDGPLRNLWFPPPDRATSYETSFIVVGPIPNDNPGHLTTGLANTS